MKQTEKPEKWGKARPWILISAPAILKNKYFYFVAALFILALSIASGNGSMTVYYCGNILKDMDMMTPLSMALTLPVIIGNCFVPAIVKKIGHQKTLILSSILMLVGFLIVAINPHSELTGHMRIFHPRLYFLYTYFIFYRCQSRPNYCIMRNNRETI